HHVGSQGQSSACDDQGYPVEFGLQCSNDQVGEPQADGPAQWYADHQQNGQLAQQNVGHFIVGVAEHPQAGEIPPSLGQRNSGGVVDHTKGNNASQQADHKGVGEEGAGQGFKKTVQHSLAQVTSHHSRGIAKILVDGFGLARFQVHQDLIN